MFYLRGNYSMLWTIIYFKNVLPTVRIPENSSCRSSKVWRTICVVVNGSHQKFCYQTKNLNYKKVYIELIAAVIRYILFAARIWTHKFGFLNEICHTINIYYHYTKIQWYTRTPSKMDMECKQEHTYNISLIHAR